MIEGSLEWCEARIAELETTGRALIKRWHCHSGACVTYMPDGKSIVTPESCKCESEEKALRKVLGMFDASPSVSELRDCTEAGCDNVRAPGEKWCLPHKSEKREAALAWSKEGSESVPEDGVLAGSLASETHPCLDCGRPTSYFAQKMQGGHWLCRDGEGCNVPRTSEAKSEDEDWKEVMAMTPEQLDAELRAMGADPIAVGDMGLVAAYLGKASRFGWPGSQQAKELQALLASVREDERKRQRSNEALADDAIQRSLKRISERMGLAEMYEHDPVGFVGVLESEVNNEKERVVGGREVEDEAARSGDSEVVGDKDREEQHDAHVLEDDDVCDGRLGSGGGPPSKTEGESEQDLVVEAGTGGRFGCCGAEPAYIRGRPVPHSHPQRTDKAKVEESKPNPEVYSRPECIWNYCCDPEGCIARNACQNPSRSAPRAETAKAEGEKR